jgi:hypothetical protein
VMVHVPWIVVIKYYFLAFITRPSRRPSSWLEPAGHAAAQRGSTTVIIPGAIRRCQPTFLGLEAEGADRLRLVVGPLLVEAVSSSSGAATVMGRLGLALGFLAAGLARLARGVATGRAVTNSMSDWSDSKSLGS